MKKTRFRWLRLQWKLLRRKIKTVTAICVGITVVYLGCLLASGFITHIVTRLLGTTQGVGEMVDSAKLNSLGDFIAGIFSPLAFLWLVAAVLIQSQELRLQRKEIANNRGVMIDQAKAAKSAADFIALQTSAMQEQVQLQKEVASTTHKVAMFDQRFAIYIALRDFKRGLYPGHFQEVDELFEKVQRVEFIFGDMFRPYKGVVLATVNKYRNAVKAWEDLYGIQTFHVYSQMQKDLVENNAIDTKTDVQYGKYLEVITRWNTAKKTQKLSEMLVVMQMYLRIDGEVGIKGQHVLSDTYKMLIEMSQKED